MNQTKKRLSIIKLAISIHDIETIQLQILKLGLLKNDDKIQEIISTLQSDNYVKAGELIEEYIDTPMEEIAQRSKQDTTEEFTTNIEQTTINEFQLFENHTQDNKHIKEIKEIDINEFLDSTPKKITEVKEINFDTLLNIDSNEVLKDNIDLDISHKNKDFEQDSKSNNILTNDIPIDKFFDTQSRFDDIKNIAPKDEEIPNYDIQKYNPKPYIREKLLNITKEYPPIIEENQMFPELDELLDKLAEESYTEDDIENKLNELPQLIKEEKYDEASQLLLICASTESKFAQLILARELYKGTILHKNIPESFELLYSLVLDDYPEALCDLGQFYEHGIGTTQDMDKATSLYREAMGHDIKRAKKHFERVTKSKGLLGRFFK